MNPKWDRRFLELARFVAAWSKDPSTQCGAVIADGKVLVSLGYNGLPQGVYDHEERYSDREIKYKMVVHAETNAILFARGSVRGMTLYTWPFGSCSRCAVQVIQSGIRRVVSPPLPLELMERWGEDVKLSGLMFREAVVKVDELEL